MRRNQQIILQTAAEQIGLGTLLNLARIVVEDARLPGIDPRMISNFQADEIIRIIERRSPFSEACLRGKNMNRIAPATHWGPLAASNGA